MGVLDEAITQLELEGYSCSVTLRTLTLGAVADSITGHFPKTFADSTIKMPIQSKGASFVAGGMGFYARYPVTGFTSTAVLEGDEIYVNSTYYGVKTVTPILIGAVIDHYQVELEKRYYDNTPDTSGTWHVDSTTTKTDPRNRQKVLIDTYLTATNIKKDDGTTNAATATCFDGATYPITRLFLIKTLDAVAVISRKSSTPLYTDKLLGRKPYAFNEEVVIEINAVNKSTITATNLAEKFENEIKRIFTTYDATANVRDLDTITPALTDLGYGYLFHTAIVVEYKRCNDDYSAALPTITYGDNQGTTYYFPNATDIKIIDPDTGDAHIVLPGRLGDYLQNLGGADFEVQITCDIDIDASNKTWKRPQASTPKTDTVNWQVLSEIKFGNKSDAQQVYQNLNWGGGTTIPVRLVDLQVNNSTVTVTFRRYSATNGASGTNGAWWGIS